LDEEAALMADDEKEDWEVEYERQRQHPLFQWRALENHPLKKSNRYVLSSDPLVVRDSTGDQHASPKPMGIWYACGSEWLDWLESEMPQWLTGGRGTGPVRYIYRLTLGTKILKLDTEDKVKAFSQKYLDRGPAAYRDYSIDWPRIAQKYHGVEAAPYFWSLRHALSWYGGWDVASGCVWNPKGIRKLTLVASEEQEWTPLEGARA
jgi:hypothetical protein